MDTAPGRGRLVGLGSLFEGGLAVLACGIGWLVGQPPWETVCWEPRAALWGFAACVPMLAFFLACIRWPVGPLGRIKHFTDEVVRPLFARCTLADLAVLSVLAGVGEELLFRGLVQAAAERWLGRWVGLALASVLFGLMHPITPGYVVLAAGMGAYLGGLWLWTGNLLAPAVAHAAYDFVALVLLVRAGLGRAAGAVSEPAPDS